MTSSASPLPRHDSSAHIFWTILLIISHTSTSKQDNVAEWLTRLVAIQIPLGAQVRILPLSFCSSFYGWTEVSKSEQYIVTVSRY